MPVGRFSGITADGKITTRTVLYCTTLGSTGRALDRTNTETVAVASQFCAWAS